jgi:hypothetical protein
LLPYFRFFFCNLKIKSNQKKNKAKSHLHMSPLEEKYTLFKFFLDSISKKAFRTQCIQISAAGPDYF